MPMLVALNYLMEEKDGLGPSIDVVDSAVSGPASLDGHKFLLQSHVFLLLV